MRKEAANVRLVATRSETPTVTLEALPILRYCASGYVAGQHWNERVCGAWSPETVESALAVAERACAPGDDPEIVLQGLRALAEMLQVDLPMQYGLDLLVEELVLLPADLLEKAVRCTARSFAYRRFPTLSEIRETVIDELSERYRLLRAVRNFAQDHRRHSGTSLSLTAACTHAAPGRGGGLRPLSGSLRNPAYLRRTQEP